MGLRALFPAFTVGWRLITEMLWAHEFRQVVVLLRSKCCNPVCRPTIF